MSDFWAVLIDLYAFVKNSFFGTRREVGSDNEVLLLPKEPATPLLIGATATAAQKSSPEPTSSTNWPFGYSAPGYIVVSKAAVFSRPVWAFDTVLTTLPYATEISVEGYQGRFVRVSGIFGEGWVLKDDVSVTKTDVWPQLVSGQTYLATDTETKLIRAVISDEFFATELFLPLRTEEFITYCLRKEGRTIAWGAERPRVAGEWHELLKGKRGVFMGVTPKTGSIMEASSNDHEPFLAYVKTVLPDTTITILAVGKEKEGEYTEEVVESSVWQTWRPVFIQVT